MYKEAPEALADAVLEASPLSVKSVKTMVINESAVVEATGPRTHKNMMLEYFQVYFHDVVSMDLRYAKKRKPPFPDDDEAFSLHCSTDRRNAVSRAPKLSTPSRTNQERYRVGPTCQPDDLRINQLANFGAQAAPEAVRLGKSKLAPVIRLLQPYQTAREPFPSRKYLQKFVFREKQDVIIQLSSSSGENQSAHMKPLFSSPVPPPQGVTR